MAIDRNITYTEKKNLYISRGYYLFISRYKNIDNVSRGYYLFICRYKNIDN